MMIRLFALLTFVALSLWHQAEAGATEIDLTASQLYARNEVVKVAVKAPAKVLVTSDFNSQSTVVDVFGSKTIEVGKVTGPGTFRIAVSDETEEAYLDILVIPDEQSKFRFITSRGKAAFKRDQDRVAADLALLKKFVKEVNRAAAQRALETAAKGWALSNPAAIGTTVVVCLLTLAEPVAAKYCKDGAKEAVGDLGIEFLLKLVDELVKSNALKKPEGERIHAWITLGKALKLVKLDPKAVDKLDELLGQLSSVIDGMEFKDANVKVILKTGVDVARKYVIVIKIVKP